MIESRCQEAYRRNKATTAACDNSHAARSDGPRDSYRTTANVTMPTNTDDPRVNTIWTALSTVIDPELGLDIVTLGLVYGVEVEGATARITYTLTTPGCPMERAITDGVRAATQAVAGIGRVDTHIVWEPAWHPGMITPNAFSP